MSTRVSFPMVKLDAISYFVLAGIFRNIQPVYMESLREQIFQVPALFIAAFFCIAIFSLNWLGHRVRVNLAKRYPDKDIGLGTAEGALMGLMALLLAFSFNMSSTKYEVRRQTIIDEANLLNTVYLRLDLYPDSIRRSVMNDFKNYVDSRIEYFEARDNPEKINAALQRADQQFKMLWNKNALLSNDQIYRSRADQLVPILINMKNIVTTRETGRKAGVPTLIVISLLMLVFVASFLTGYGVKPGNRSPLFSLAFAIMTSGVMFLVMELERPRQGFINLNNAEQAIVNVRNCLP